MARNRSSRRSTWAVCVAALVVAALALGATQAADTTTTTSSGSGKSSGALKNLGHGVTKDSVKVGIAIIDYDSIADYVDYARGDQQQTAEVFVDAINKAGGIDGRKIVPYYKSYPPIPGRQPDPLSLCTSWSEDDGVFAVLGVFIDMTGQGILCLTKEHKVIHIGHELEQSWIDQSPPGLLLTTDFTKESAAKVLVNLLAAKGKLKGKKIAVIADQSSEPRVTGTILPALKAKGVKTGSNAVLSITGTDTTAAQAQLDSFIEKWKSEGVNAVELVGPTVNAKQFVETIRSSMPKVQLISDSDVVLTQAQDETAAGKKPNPYEGILTTTGRTDTERWTNKSPLYQQCVNTYQKATGKTIPGPANLEKNAKGKRIDLYLSVMDFCGELGMFKTIADRVGPDLTVANWQKTVNNFGPINLVSTPYASLCKGKYAADNAFSLVQFNSSLGNRGDWKKLTPVTDASGGQCAKAG